MEVLNFEEVILPCFFIYIEICTSEAKSLSGSLNHL
jgi:hypothetical protein